MIGHELICDLDGAAALAPEWDRLAVAASAPVACPAWVTGWWRHVAPPGMQARVVAVREGPQLIGVVPLRAVRRPAGVWEYRLMGDDFGVCMQPLAMPGREWDVAAELGRALRAGSPRAEVLSFGPMTLASPWTADIAAAWPGRLAPLVRTRRLQGAPVIVLGEPDYEQWLAGLGSKLRRDLRRCERLFAQAGGSTRWADAGSLAADARAFARLHAARWAGRGWSRLAALGERLPVWLEELGAELIGSGRLGLCVLEIDGEPICVDLHLLAGAEAVGVNVGWDERRANLAPARLALLRVVAAAYGRGAGRVHLGVGEPASKLRIANGRDAVAWTSLLLPGRGLGRAYGVLAPELARARARDMLTRSLPPERLAQVKRAAARLRT